MIDVGSDHRKELISILSEYIPGMEIWAFGSRVSGKAGKTSDLDLAIVSEAPLSLAILGALKDALSASNIPYKVDLLDLSRADPAFRRHIEKSKTVFIARD